MCLMPRSEICKKVMCDKERVVFFVLVFDAWRFNHVLAQSKRSCINWSVKAGHAAPPYDELGQKPGAPDQKVRVNLLQHQLVCIFCWNLHHFWKKKKTNTMGLMVDQDTSPTVAVSERKNSTQAGTTGDHCASNALVILSNNGKSSVSFYCSAFFRFQEISAQAFFTGSEQWSSRWMGFKPSCAVRRQQDLNYSRQAVTIARSGTEPTPINFKHWEPQVGIQDSPQGGLTWESEIWAMVG